MKEESNNDAPSVLRFAWGYEPRRNPNLNGETIFPMFGRGVNRFEMNLHLNWLLRSILDKAKQSRFNDLKDTLRIRALEAVLSMIGYSVRENPAVFDEEAAFEESEFGYAPDHNCTFATTISENLKECGIAIIATQRKERSFSATWTEDGVVVSNLGESYPLLPWRVFDEVELLLREKNGRAKRGNARAAGAALGGTDLPLDSVEGRVAERVYMKQIGDSTLQRITPISCLLVWAGLCQHGSGELQTSAQIGEQANVA